MTALVRTFAKASQHLDAIDPNRYVPDGLMGSRSCDAIPLPADLAAVVDLMPYTGLNLTMTGAEIKTIQQQNASARQLSLKTKKAPPAMDDVWHRGLLTETHAIRVAQLERAAVQPLEGDIGHLIQQSSKRATEGVLLSVQEGKLASQALRIDARSGALKAYGSALTLGRSGRRARFGPSTWRRCRCTRSSYAATPRCSRACRRPRWDKGRRGEHRPCRRQFAIGAAPRSARCRPLRCRRPRKDIPLGRYSAAFKDYQRRLAAGFVAARAGVVDFPTVAAAAPESGPHQPARNRAGASGVDAVVGGAERRLVERAVANSFISTRLDLTLAETLRFLIPRTFDRVMHFRTVFRCRASWRIRAQVSAGSRRAAQRLHHGGEDQSALH
jgi:hypothetical protein